LGAGTLAGYGQAGDRYVFYDINPLVIRVAQAQFAFLRESRAETQVVPGDARLSLEREPAREFDVFLVDAFSGDAIPIHLLTREAFEIYLRLLRPHGVLAIHISNKYLDLEPVVRAAARSLGLSAATVVNTADEPNSIFTATWVLLARDPLDIPVHSPAITWEINPPRDLRPWTDDYSNLLEILK
jgi:spermidine synthase